MSSNTRVPKAQITGVYGAAMTRFSAKMFGVVPEPLQVMWHHRPVLRLYLGLGQRAGRWSACDENLTSYAHLAVASLVGCSWCLDLGYFQANNEGLDVRKAREVPRWRESEVFTPLEGFAAACGLAPVAQPRSARSIVGAHRVAAFLVGLAENVPGFETGPVWLNGGPAMRIDLEAALDTVASLVVEDGRITRIYAIRNPHKLTRVDGEAHLSR